MRWCPSSTHAGIYGFDFPFDPPPACKPWIARVVRFEQWQNLPWEDTIILYNSFFCAYLPQGKNTPPWTCGFFPSHCPFLFLVSFHFWKFSSWTTAHNLGSQLGSKDVQSLLSQLFAKQASCSCLRDMHFTRERRENVSLRSTKIKGWNVARICEDLTGWEFARFLLHGICS